MCIRDSFKNDAITLSDSSTQNARVLAGAAAGTLQNDGVEAQRISLA